MSPGYGDRIYTKRPSRIRRVWWLLLLLAVLGLWLLITRLGPQKGVGYPSDAEKDKLSTTQPSATPQVMDLPTVSPPPEQHTSPSFPQSPDPMKTEGNPSANEMSLIHKAGALMEQRKHHEAIKLITPLCQSNPLAMLLAAKAHFALMHYDESRLLYERFLRMDPGNLQAIKSLIDICYAQNRLEDAQKYCSMALAIDEDDDGLRFLAQKLRNELATASDFTSRESQHFSVSFDRGSHDDIRHTVLSILEEAHRTMGRDLGVYPERIIPVILYTQKTFFDVTRAPGWAGGLYDGKIRLPVSGLVNDEAELTRILTHEYVHALVHQLSGDCPRWINEGLAEYLSREEVPRIGQRIPLTQLERYFPSSPVNAVAIAYAESHAAVDYLIERYSLNDLLELLKKLGQGIPFTDAFAEVYYIDYSQFLESWGKE